MLKDISRILITRIRYIGDVILTTPFIRAVRRAYPKAYIAYMSEAKPSEVLKENPYLDDLIVCKKNNIYDSICTINAVRKKKFDMVIDLFSNPRTALITFFSGAKYRVGFKVRLRTYAYNIFIGEKIKKNIVKQDALDVYEDVMDTIGIKKYGRFTEFFLTKEEKQKADKYFKDKRVPKNKIVIGINPGASRQARMWIPERFSEVADRIIDDKNVVILFGGPSEKEIVRKVYEKMKNKPVIAANLDLRDFAAVVNKCNVFLSSDNGLLHISAALKVPTIGIFGPQDPEIWCPYDRKNFVYVKKYPDCWPCDKDECDDLKCMKMINSQEIYKLVKKYGYKEKNKKNINH